ncbi:MAG TPA: hypothetical protein VG076_07020 [Acidimicrobiales bacterium]|nr:hypothetical protein [Acidimicrobiales bacterium]
MAFRERSLQWRFALVGTCVALVSGACGHGRTHLDRAAGVATPTTLSADETSTTAAATTTDQTGTPSAGAGAKSATKGRTTSTTRPAAGVAAPRRRRGGPAQPGPVTFHVYDRNGTRLDWSAFRAVEENGKGSAGSNDMLLDPDTLTVVTPQPLHSNGGDPGFDLPPQIVTLSLSWPTVDGYSMLLVDVDKPGVQNFSVLAADRAVADLDDAVAARPSYRPSAAFTDASRQAHDHLAAAHGVAPEAAQGAQGAQGLDSAVHAMTTLLTEYGQQYGRATRATNRPQWGVTFDDISGGSGDLATVRDLVGGDAADGWVRIVFDRTEAASSYTGEVNAAHGLGLRVVGQFLDSSDMKSVGVAEWQARVASYVSTLPSVDEWEVGNEVNGNWLGADVAAKVAYAASYVKAHTTARTLLTLYWQIGEDDATHSMFTWLHANVSAATMGAIDDVGISLYPEDHPMGAAFDRVMATLHDAAPGRRIMVTELDYWSPDLAHTWWWGSTGDPTGAARRQVAVLYQSAVLGYQWSGGGGYWWYYLAEALPKNQLWSTLASVHAAVAG